MTHARRIAVAACIASATVHLGLVPGHAAGSPLLAASFLGAGFALIAIAAALHAHVRAAAPSAVLLLLALVAAYFLERAAGLPGATDRAAAHARQIDGLGLATRAVELIGAAAATAVVFQRASATVRSDPSA